MKKYKYIQSGEIFSVVIDDAVNATEGCVADRMVIYIGDGEVFVREYEEFHKKFKPWKNTKEST